MSNKIFLNVDEVAEALGISKPHAYKQIQQLNAELRQKGYCTVAGKVNRKYFCERFYIEIGGVTPTDIDFDKQTINVTKSYKKLNGKEIISDPKTKKSIRIVVMPEEICEELKEYIDSFYKIEKNQRIFNFSSSFLHHEMSRSSKAAGLDRIPVHGLRHSHVSLLIDMGWDAVKVAERMGHEAIDITYEYAHMFPNVQQEIAKSLNKLIKGDDADEQE